MQASDKGLGELEQLTEAELGIMVAAGEREILVRPLKVRQFAAVMRAMRPTVAILSDQDDIDVDALITKFPEAMIETVSVATDLTVEEVGNLALDQFVAVATAVLEVNSDFFAQRLRPLLDAAGQKLGMRYGQTSSRASSAQGTG